MLEVLAGCTPCCCPTWPLCLFPWGLLEEGRVPSALTGVGTPEKCKGGHSEVEVVLPRVWKAVWEGGPV